METSGKNYGYIEWLSAEEMHDASKRWMSELKFVRDEQFFLNDLVKSHTLQLVDSQVFKESKDIVDAIAKGEKDVVVLMKRIQSHENLLKIMVNDINELKMEKAYLETHWELVREMQTYMSNYRQIKSRLFELVSEIMKKHKRLLT